MTKYYLIKWRTVSGAYHGGEYNHLDNGGGEKEAVKAFKKHLRRFHPGYKVAYSVDVLTL